MGAAKPSYEELEARLAEAQSALKAIGNESIDALVGRKGVYLLRLSEMEKALQDSEAKMRSIFRAAPIGIGLVSNRVIQEVNDYFCRLSGYAGDELIGQNARLLFCSEEEYESAFRDKFEQIEKWTPDAAETRLLRKDGTIIHVLINSYPLDPHDLSLGITITALNISRQKQAEENLKAERIRLETVLQQLPEGVIIAEGRSGKIIYSNAQVAKIWGRDFVAARSIDQYAAYSGYHPDGKPYLPHEWPLARTIATGEIIESEEIKFQRGDGSFGWLAASSTPIRDKAGNVVTGVVTFTDITARKQLEEDLRENNQELTEYAYALTHNIKAPLRAISNYVTFLFEDLADTLQGDPKKFLEGISASVTKSNKQFADLEALYGIKNHALNLEAFPMQELLDEMQFLFKDTPNGLIIVQENWPVLKGERLLLRQILINLIGNGL
ncbi:MAG: PAS domain S-box protein [Desulfobacterales bacterium]